MAGFIKQAFETVCKEAIPATDWYVSLMEVVPYYGGPEEGGWWGRDTVLVSFQRFPSKELAEMAAGAVQKLADELSEQSRRSFGEQCLREMNWLEARGLDADFLPEPDGESTFFVEVTEGAPAEEHYGTRGYE